MLCRSKHLLLAQAAAESQKRGKPGQLVDPRPQSVDGEVKIVITPQLVHDIFEEFPIVAKAYNDNVPGKVTHIVMLTARSDVSLCEVVGSGILESLLPIQAFQRPSRVHSFVGCTTRRKGRSDLRQIP